MVEHSFLKFKMLSMEIKWEIIGPVCSKLFLF